jgi:N-acetylmuramoyl-L-alanine amidase
VGTASNVSAGCKHAEPDTGSCRAGARPLIRHTPSPNHDERPEGTPIDTLVLHYTGMRSAGEAIALLCATGGPKRVSSHYVVEEDGLIHAMAPEARRAWHAGISHWRGHEGLNGRSIGIEIVNPGHEWGYRPFPALQMAAVADLCLGILARHPIPPRNVVAHSDIAPDRKEDPGELFDWEGLARLGIGLWPQDAPATEGTDPLPLLARIGYRTDLPLKVLLTAFQRHWRQEQVDGQADASTMARLTAVAGLVAAD